MKSINLTVSVPSNRRITIELPEEVRPGEDASVTVLVQPRRRARGLMATLPQVDMHWPAGLEIHRKDLYGDDGR
jgi:hypothetical protein